MPNTRPILEARNISKIYKQPIDVPILNGIDISVRRGETIAIMGRSGEGKSTLLQILGTLDDPSTGDIVVDGVPVTAFNRSRLRNQKFGFIFQSFHLLEDYSALDNILMPAKIARKNVSKRSPTYLSALELLEAVGLSARAHFNTKLLSGGEKQRIAIARALCNDPDILLADEPSGNLDRMTAQNIHKLLLHFAASRNKTLIVVTHDVELARLCNTQYFLSEGKLFPTTL